VSHETETGFGTGLRAQLERKLGGGEEAVAVVAVEPAVETLDPFAVEELLPLVAEPPSGEPMTAELEAALAREQQMRHALEERVKEYERDLDAARELEEREAAVAEIAARTEVAQADLVEAQLVLKIQRDQLESDRVELSRERAEIAAETARVNELATHVDSRAAELESVDRERAQAAAHVAQQLAGLAERERELRRERAALDTVRQEQEAGFLAREDGVRKLDAAARERQRAAAEREVALRAVAGELEERRQSLQAQADEIAERDAGLARRYDAREKMLANGEVALAAREARVRQEEERLERARSGQGQVSADAFALLSELDQREERVQLREQRMLENEARLAERAGQLAQTEEELRLREARMVAEVELREDRLDKLERDVAEREELIGFRERDLSAYVGELQGQISGRNVA
jgi:chromosome segregation ATPase